MPYVHTISTFLTRRSFEQIAIDVALERLPVILVGAGGGMVYAPLGPTHQAIDDFALMRSIPGMFVCAPADPLEMRTVLEMLFLTRVPCYVRVAKGGEPIVTSDLVGLEMGKARPIFLGEKLAVITTGALLHECIEAASNLLSDGVGVTLYHFPFIEPLDHEAISFLADTHDCLLIVEEHIPQGGLGSAILEFLCDHKISSMVSRLTLPNTYARNYGTQQEHWKLHGIDGAGIQSTILNILSELTGSRRVEK